MTAKDASLPMTLANMRSLGVRSVESLCRCGREAIVDVSALSGDITVPSLQGRLRCSGCGERLRHCRPNWLELRLPGMGRAAL